MALEKEPMAHSSRDIFPLLIVLLKDKPVAFLGIAKSLSQEMNCDYLAGLWRKSLEHQSPWKVNRHFWLQFQLEWIFLGVSWLFNCEPL
jgi:hypothetical protein